MTQQPVGASFAITLPGAFTVHVRLHGPAADGAPQRELSVTVPAASTTEALWDVLVTRMPTLASLRPQCALAIDNSWAAPSAPLHEGARVDVIPPVSGG